MGCGSISQHQASLSASAAGPRRFLPRLTDREFVNQLGPEELKEKKLLLAYFHLHGEAQGHFEATPQLIDLVRRRGVPQRYRWLAWKTISGWSALQNPGIWEGLSRRRADPKVVDSIEKDLDRTFPQVEDFGDERKHELANILRAFACLFPQVGYCQGMNFVAGFILRNSPDNSPEESFFMLVQLMTQYQANLLFCDGLPLLKLYTFQFRTLLERLFPEVHRHFVAENITPELYVTKWFLTVFTQRLPFPVATRLWDLIVCDGLQSLVLLALATVKLLRPRLLRETTEGILELFSLKDGVGVKAGGALVGLAIGLATPCALGLDARLSKLRADWVREYPEDAAELERAASEFCNARPSAGAASWAPDPTRSLSPEGLHKRGARLKRFALGTRRSRSTGSVTSRGSAAAGGHESPLLGSFASNEATLVALSQAAFAEDGLSEAGSTSGRASGNAGTAGGSDVPQSGGGAKAFAIAGSNDGLARKGDGMVSAGPSGAALANAARYASAAGAGGCTAEGLGADDAVGAAGVGGHVASGSPHTVGAEAKVEVTASMPSRRAAGLRLQRSSTLPVGIGAALGAPTKCPAGGDAAVVQRRSVSSAHSPLGAALRKKWAQASEISGLGQTPLSPSDSSSSGAFHGGLGSGSGRGMATPPKSSSSKIPGTSARGAILLPLATERPDEVSSPNGPDGSPSVTSGLSTESSPPARQADLGGSSARGDYRRFLSPLREDAISKASGEDRDMASYPGRLPRIVLPGMHLGVRVQKANASGTTWEPPSRAPASVANLGRAGAVAGTRRRDSSRGRREGCGFDTTMP